MSAAPTLAELEQARANLEALLRAVRAKVCPEGADSPTLTFDAIDARLAERDEARGLVSRLRVELYEAYLALESALDWAKSDHSWAHEHDGVRVAQCNVPPAEHVVCGWWRRVARLQAALDKRVGH